MREGAILLSSYVFEAPSSMEPSIEFPMHNAVRVLSSGSGIWWLRGRMNGSSGIFFVLWQRDSCAAGI